MSESSVVAIVDDDAAVRRALGLLVESIGVVTRGYSSGTEFLEQWDSTTPACVLLDIRMPDISGLDVQDRLLEEHPDLPIIFLTSHGDVQVAVQALKKGAFDFFEKPGFNREALLACIQRALRLHGERTRRRAHRDEIGARLERLSKREREVMEGVIAGYSNKRIANDLGISERTVEVHRSHVMDKLEVHSVVELVRLYQETDSGNH